MAFTGMVAPEGRWMLAGLITQPGSDHAFATSLTAGDLVVSAFAVPQKTRIKNINIAWNEGVGASTGTARIVLYGTKSPPSLLYPGALIYESGDLTIPTVNPAFQLATATPSGLTVDANTLYWIGLWLKDTNTGGDPEYRSFSGNQDAMLSVVGVPNTATSFSGAGITTDIDGSLYKLTAQSSVPTTFTAGATPSTDKQGAPVFAIERTD
jgi:hypothetical protein